MALAPHPIGHTHTKPGRTENCNNFASLKSLIDENQKLEFKLGNLPIRFIYANHLDICVNKLSRPDSFCWPGIYYSRVTDDSGDIQRVFKQIEPPFIIKSDGNRPSVNIRIDSQKSNATKFHATYSLWQILYDCTRGLIAERGMFNINKVWSVNMSKSEQLRVREECSKVLGREINDIKIL